MKIIILEKYSERKIISFDSIILELHRQGRLKSLDVARRFDVHWFIRRTFETRVRFPLSKSESDAHEARWSRVRVTEELTVR